MRMETFDSSWEYGAEVTDPVFNEILQSNPSPGRNARKLKELMSPKDLTLLDLYERERQLAAREAAAIRLEEHGRKQEIAARETALLGRETALVMKERELRLTEREQIVHDSEVRMQEQEAKLNLAKHKVTELENEFYRKLQRENILTSTRERELRIKEDEIRNEESKLLKLKMDLNEKKNEIEQYENQLKDENDSLKIRQNDLEEREKNVKVKENRVEEKKKILKELKNENEINNEAARQEFETTKLSLEKRDIHLRNMETTLVIQERELNSKKLEIEQELEKQDAILKDTTNIIAEKEEELKKLERETMEKIEAQEEELKHWEIELQQQESKIRDHQQNLEKCKVEMLEREKAIEIHGQHLLNWEEHLQSRAQTLNEQAEAQEEHLRVILEKERIFEELKITLEQKEQQYKLLVQCKEHEFDVREQNLQKIILDLLQQDRREKKALYTNVTFSKKPFLLIDEDYDNGQLTKLVKDETFKHTSTSNGIQKDQEKIKMSSSSTSSDKNAVKYESDRECTISSKRDQQEGSFPKTNTKISSPEVPHSRYFNNSQISAKNKQRLNLLISPQYIQNPPIHEKSLTKTLLPEIPPIVSSEGSLRNNFTLTEEQIILLKQLKNNTYRKEDTDTKLQPQFQNLIQNFQKENLKSLKIVEKLKQPFKEDRYIEENFKQSFFRTVTRTKSSNVSHWKNNISEDLLPDEHSTIDQESNDIISHPQTRTKSRSTSCEDLREGLDTDLNEQNTLHGATKGFRIEMVHALMEQQGANVDCRDPEGKTALHWAAQLGHLSLVKYLGGEMGASVDAQTNAGHTALHLAALEGRLDVVQYLTEALGANLDIQDQNGETALHLAAGAGWLEVVKFISGIRASYTTKPSILTCVPKIK